MWNGDYWFVIRSLVAKDFKVRYRNMSLGVLWSLLNPLIMMSVMTFITTQIFSSTMKHYPLAVLCGLVPFNFFSLAWLTGTVSLLENASLIKRVPVPRQIFPIASVLSNCMHLVIQIGLLLALVLVFGSGVNIYWLWLPVIWVLEIIFVPGPGADLFGHQRLCARHALRSGVGEHHPLLAGAYLLFLRGDSGPLSDGVRV